MHTTRGTQHKHARNAPKSPASSLKQVLSAAAAARIPERVQVPADSRAALQHRHMHAATQRMPAPHTHARTRVMHTCDVRSRAPCCTEASRSGWRGGCSPEEVGKRQARDPSTKHGNAGHCRRRHGSNGHLRRAICVSRSLHAANIPCCSCFPAVLCVTRPSRALFVYVILVPNRGRRRRRARILMSLA